MDKRKTVSARAVVAFYCVHTMPKLQEKALLEKLFYQNQQNCSFERIPPYEADRKVPMSSDVVRKMIQKFETTGQINILSGRGRKQIPSSSIKKCGYWGR
ncbi:hypothetical protein TNCV_2874411 [Trichonephila clavipes]|nr:hypothetical protein TNCV_2874411 [Trichonephila clavipes]